MSEDPLAPYDAVLVQSFGGPEGPEEVLPFLRRVTAGKDIPDERLREVGAHYDLFGGRSPINALGRALVADLEAALRARGSAVPVRLGNRHSDPFVADVLAGLVEDGVRRVVALPTSAWRSYSSCRQYREDLARAVSEIGRPALTVDKVRPYAEHPGFAATYARHVVEAVRAQLAVGQRPHLLFVSHSVPDSMDETSGPGDEEGRAYSGGQVDLARLVADEVETATGVRLEAGLAFCSRSGPAHVPWLEPDVNDRLVELADEGVRSVVLVPVGFVADHMEVVYDLDTEARATAERVGIQLARVPTVGPDPAFVDGLVDLLLERAAQARGEEVTPATWSGLPAAPAVCPAGCCPNLRSPAPALCGKD